MRYMLTAWPAGPTRNVDAWAWPWHHLNLNVQTNCPKSRACFWETAFCLCCTGGCWKLDRPVGWTFLARCVTVAHLLKEWLKNKTQQNRQTSRHSGKGRGWSFLFFGWIPFWEASPCFPSASGQALLCEGTWIWRDLQRTRLCSQLQRKVSKVIIFWQLQTSELGQCWLYKQYELNLMTWSNSVFAQLEQILHVDYVA